MPQEPRDEHAKPEKRNSGAYAILYYFTPGVLIPSRKIDRQLRKLDGIKDITINPLTHTIKISYNPSVVTGERIRSVVRGLSSSSFLNRRNPQFDGEQEVNKCT